MLAGVYKLPLQAAAPHVCVLSAFWQAPVIAMPVLPHLFVVLSSWQLLYGSSPAFTEAQVPSATFVCAFLHELQRPLHALLQHIPSTQFPEPHCVAAAHTAPLSFVVVQVLVLGSQ